MTTRQRLLRILLERGALPPEWHDAVASVDRALFIPEVIVGGDFAEDPEEWLRIVYADGPVVTQVNDGKPTAGDAFRLPTSSSSMPSIMLEMLALLDVREGHRVLEIGTGTGYHAAWLSHRLGEANVTSVELDETVLTQANRNLKRAGFRPTTILGNGRDGHRRGAPYDRIISTCTMRDVPRAWLEQCPDGRIVTPWGSSFFSGSFATLDVVDGKARGAFSGSPAFMWDRTHRGGAGRVSVLYHGEEGEKGTTDIAPQNVVQDDPAFFIGLGVTDAWFRWCDADDDSGEATLWFFADDGRSWATVEYVPDARTYEVEQYGPRALWDEVREAFLRWHDLGKPERSRFGLSVDVDGDGDGRRVWLDDPAGAVGRL
ncbi:methyltransferase domain-containing protein [Streptomyces sp. NPDC001553]|uniref:methyltransferase domain-containing protein n=1 Tax=Streptomyces sp. NPDC001553 TaxID=3154385 RepID=UPI003319EE28